MKWEDSSEWPKYKISIVFGVLQKKIKSWKAMNLSYEIVAAELISLANSIYSKFVPSEYIATISTAEPSGFEYGRRW